MRFRARTAIVAGTMALALALGSGCDSGSTKIKREPLAIVTTQLPSGQVGQFYFGLAEGQGGKPPVTWAVSLGTLPDGLALDPKGSITGIPTATGTFVFDLTLSDSANKTDTGSFFIDIVASTPLTITSTSPLPNGNVGVPYSTQIQTSGGFGSRTFSLTNGSVPTGLLLDGATGEISGQPRSQGMSTFEVTVVDSAQPIPNQDSATFELTIDAGLPANHLLINEVDVGTRDFVEIVNPTGASVDIAGWYVDIWWEGYFNGSYTFQAFSLPAGSAIVIYEGAGTDQLVAPPYTVYSGFNFPHIVGEEFEGVLFDSAGMGVDYIAINDHGTATHVPPNLSWSGVVNQLVDRAKGIFHEVVMRLSYVDTDNALDLQSFDASTATPGTPNPGQAPHTILLGSSLLWDGYTGLPYFQKLTTNGGLGPYTYSAPVPAALPPGLSVDPAEGAIAGVPTTPGTYVFDITTTDSFSIPATHTGQVQITIISATLGSATDIKMNEIATEDPDYVEIINKGTGAVDISGWHIQIFEDIGGGGADLFHFTLPRGVVLPAGQILYIPEGTGGFTSQFQTGTGFNIVWNSPAPGGCAIVDASFQHVDYMNWNNPANPLFPAGTVWTGSVTLGVDEGAERSLSAADTDDAADWCAFASGTGTPGVANRCP